jgi:hypothetical protein
MVQTSFMAMNCKKKSLNSDWFLATKVWNVNSHWGMNWWIFAAAVVEVLEEEGNWKLCRCQSTHWQALKEFDPGTTPFVMSLDVLNVLVLLLGGFLNSLEFCTRLALRCVLYVSAETMPKLLSVMHFFTVLWYDHIASCHVLFCIGQNWHNV